MLLKVKKTSKTVLVTHRDSCQAPWRGARSLSFIPDVKPGWAGSADFTSQVLASVRSGGEGGMPTSEEPDNPPRWASRSTSLAWVRKMKSGLKEQEVSGFQDTIFQVKRL